MTDATPVPSRPDPAEEALRKKQRSEDGENHVIEHHNALKNQSSVSADQYPDEDRKAQSLVTPSKSKRDKTD